MKPAWLFPGQGSQAVGMGRDLWEWSAAARAVFAEADDTLGFSLSGLCFAGPEEELRRTANTQPALLTVEIAAARALTDLGMSPDAVAGHSLGEYAALVAAGALRFPDALKVVRRRGECMQAAVPEGVGAMAAILGLDAAAVEEICRGAAQGEVVAPANLNAPEQVVIAGHAGGVARAIDLARQRGAKRAVPLKVSAPFHCELMEPAARDLEDLLGALRIEPARVPVWVNVDARPLREAEALRNALRRQIVAPVRWEATLRGMDEAGVKSFLEVGPGTVLAGLVRRTLGPDRVRGAGSRSEIEALHAATP